jgi:anti-sigma factor (TIGR02949 family)
MPCRELIEVITEYLEGGLAAEDRTRFEEHLEACSACRMYLDQFETVIRTLGRIEEDQLDAELRAGLVAAFSDWHG